MDIRRYEAERDLGQVQRIWREVGWLEPDNETQDVAVETFFSCGTTLVASIDGEVECAVHRTPGTILYQESDLPLAGITAVTTSRVARRTGVAAQLTARSLAEVHDEGAAVAALGIFDQGYYDKFGFGTGPYENELTFDPAALKVDVAYRNPVRLTIDDHEEMHAAMRARSRLHGAISFDPSMTMKAEIGLTENYFGLGYRDGSGTLTHFIAGSAKGEHGPYKVTWYAWQSATQLLELLRLLKELGDQVEAVTMMEPPELQLQDLIDRPFRGRRAEKHSDHGADAWWQLRILDLDACIGAHRSQVDDLACNLTLTDPLAVLRDTPWTGIGGDYTLRFGTPCSLEPGHTEGLPALASSINAFTRMWFGVRPASHLAISTDLDASAELLAQLDRAIHLPPPKPGWDF